MELVCNKPGVIVAIKVPFDKSKFLEIKFNKVVRRLAGTNSSSSGLSNSQALPEIPQGQGDDLIARLTKPRRNFYDGIIEKLERKYTSTGLMSHSDEDDNDSEDQKDAAAEVPNQPAAPELRPKKRKVRASDRDSYDFSDTFIDDSEAVNQLSMDLISRQLETKYGGFFVSKGELEVVKVPRGRSSNSGKVASAGALAGSSQSPRSSSSTGPVSTLNTQPADVQGPESSVESSIPSLVIPTPLQLPTAATDPSPTPSPRPSKIPKVKQSAPNEIPKAIEMAPPSTIDGAGSVTAATTATLLAAATTTANAVIPVPTTNYISSSNSSSSNSSAPLPMIVGDDDHDEEIIFADKKERNKKQLPLWTPTAEVIAVLAGFREDSAAIFTDILNSSPQELKFFQKSFVLPLRIEDKLFVLHEIVSKSQGNKLYKTSGYLESLCSTIKDTANIDLNCQKMKKIIHRIYMERMADQKAAEINELISNLKKELVKRIFVVQPPTSGTQSATDQLQSQKPEGDEAVDATTVTNTGPPDSNPTAESVPMAIIGSISATDMAAAVPEKWECRWTGALRNSVLDITDKVEAWILLENTWRAKLTNAEKRLRPVTKLNSIEIKEYLHSIYVSICDVFPPGCARADPNYLRGAVVTLRQRAIKAKEKAQQVKEEPGALATELLYSTNGAANSAAPTAASIAEPYQMVLENPTE